MLLMSFQVSIVEAVVARRLRGLLVPWECTASERLLSNYILSPS